MHCKDCEFWNVFSKKYIKEKKIFEDGYCHIQERVMIASDLCKHIKQRREIYEREL